MESFINMLNDTLHMNGQLFCFLVSLFPILELRGGLIAAALCKVPLWQALPICIVGNFLPPFALKLKWQEDVLSHERMKTKSNRKFHHFYQI